MPLYTRCAVPESPARDEQPVVHTVGHGVNSERRRLGFTLNVNRRGVRAGPQVRNSHKCHTVHVPLTSQGSRRICRAYSSRQTRLIVTVLRVQIYGFGKGLSCQEGSSVFGTPQQSSSVCTQAQRACALPAHGDRCFVAAVAAIGDVAVVCWSWERSVIWFLK